jgi:hypothetical protein
MSPALISVEAGCLSPAAELALIDALETISVGALDGAVNDLLDNLRQPRWVQIIDEVLCRDTAKCFCDSISSPS